MIDWLNVYIYDGTHDGTVKENPSLRVYLDVLPVMSGRRKLLKIKMTKTQKDRLFALYFIEAKHTGIPVKNIGCFKCTTYYNNEYCMYIQLNTKGRMTNRALNVLKHCGLFFYADFDQFKIIKTASHARSGTFKKRITLDKLISAKDIIGDELFTTIYNYTLRSLLG